MKVQTSFFENDEPIARTTDFETSRLSAEEHTTSGKRDAQKRMVLDAVSKYPNMTCRELAEISGIENEIMHKRLPDLRRDGWVINGDARECLITNRQAVTWKKG